MKRIVLTGGGTAGHVTPNLALIPRLQADGWEIHYIGGRNSVEQGLIEAVPGVEYHGISCGKFRRYFDLKNFTDPARVIKGFAQAKKLLRQLRPDVIFSKGGFVSVPVVYAAATCKIPVVSHESDMTPGLANKLCAPFVKCECCTFAEAARLAGKKGVYTGSPIRPEILQGDRERGLARFGFEQNRPVLMVVGGSSGAQAINNLVRSALEALTETFQVLHLCGKGNLVSSLVGTEHYYQCEYLDEEMADAYACSDIVISRAGSNTLCELLALCKPSLLIPYPKAASRGDQILNAESFQRQGFARVLMQEDATPELLLQEVSYLYHDRGQLYENMKHAPASQGLENVLKEIYRYVKTAE